MADLLDRASRLIQSEGFTGAHSFIFLTRYAALQDDKALLRLVGETLEELSTLPESATLAYAYAEYYEASRSGFCPAAAEFLLARASRNDPMLLSALAKSARVFGSPTLLERAIDLAEDELEEEREDPFTALGLLELYRATQHGDYLNRASDLAVRIRRNFQQKFDPSSVYDLEQPSAQDYLDGKINIKVCGPGAELVTEGILTMNRTLALFEEGALPHPDRESGAEKLHALLHCAQTVRFYVGCAVNPSQQDERLPIPCRDKLLIVEKISDILEGLGKETEIAVF